MVVDASGIVDLLLVKEPEASWVAERLLDATGRLRAPHLLDVEVTAAIRRLELQREVTRSRAGQAIEDFLEFRLERYPHRHLLGRVWQLRHRLTAADATYIALAEALDLPLLTTDRALGRSHGHRARVVVFPG